MKTFLRENKMKLLLLCIPVVCLIVLWNLNVYKIWYYKTSWWNLGTPKSVEPARIGSVDFYLPSASSRPGVSIFDAQGVEHISARLGRGWPRFSRSKAELDKQRQCAQEIQNKWRIKNKIIPDAKVVDARGLCVENAYQYAVYQIRPNGDVWEKYMNSWEPEELRGTISNVLCLLIALSLPVWIDTFWGLDHLKLKPDYDAN